jgi:hypothetical protein
VNFQAELFQSAKCQGIPDELLLNRVPSADQKGGEDAGNPTCKGEDADKDNGAAPLIQNGKRRE